MKTRPTSVSVIAWFLIVTACITLISTTMMIDNPSVREIMDKSPIPISIQYAMAYFGMLVSLVSGFFMLKGGNWARKFYVAWSAIGFVIGFATSPMKAAMIPGLVIFLVIAFFLFRPKANEFFATPGLPQNA